MLIDEFENEKVALKNRATFKLIHTILENTIFL